MFLVKNTTKQKIPKIDFESIKNDILGKDYELSLLFCGDRLSQKLNKQYRNKNYVPNTLSFPYSKNEGEIIINPRKAKKEAKDFGHKADEHILFLFVHSLLHLKGMTHSEKMEELEDELFEKYRREFFG